MIEVKQLTRKFDQFVAVDNLSFSLKPGEVLGFLGPNGAGKSTTMKMITGFLSPSEGSVSICGHDIQTDALAAKKLIGYLPEGAPSYPEMTVYDFLAFIAEARGIEKSQRLDRISQVVAEVQLQKVLYQPIETLSKGYKRRVGLAQAIIHDPKVLILDEPTDGLDPNQKHQVRQLIQSMAKDKIIIISTHILEEVSAVCTRAMIIANGKKLSDGTPAELMQQSKYHGAVSIRGNNILDINAIESQPWVEQVEVRQHENKITIIGRERDGLLPMVESWLKQHNVHAEEIFVEQGSLDDVFRSLTVAGETSINQHNSQFAKQEEAA